MMHSQDDDNDDTTSDSSREPSEESDHIAVDNGIVEAAPEIRDSINRACTGKADAYARSPKIVIKDLGARSYDNNNGQSSIPSGVSEREQKTSFERSEKHVFK